MYAARQARRAIFSCLTLILSDDTVLIFIVFLEKLMKIMGLGGALNIHFKYGGPGYLPLKWSIFKDTAMLMASFFKVSVS